MTIKSSNGKSSDGKSSNNEYILTGLDWDGVPDDENPEWTENDWKNAKFGLDGLAEIIGENQVAPLRLRGRPIKEDKKILVHLRLDAIVAEKFRATGKGWQTRINALLNRAIEQGQV